MFKFLLGFDYLTGVFGHAKDLQNFCYFSQSTCKEG